MLMIVQTIATEAATIATRGGQQKDVNAFGCVFRKRATHPQGFVIGVREHSHQSRSPHDSVIRLGELAAVNSRRSLEQT
jgi:hypothetical protein